MLTLISAVLALGFGLSTVVLAAKWTEARAEIERFGVVGELEAHKAKLAQAADALKASVSQTQAELKQLEAHRADKLRQIKADTERLEVERLAKEQELQSVEEVLEIQSFGFYRPRYGFDSSSKYQARLTEVRDKQKALIKADQAALCDAEWRVEGSVAKGKKMVKEQVKLMLRAFNGETDAAVAKVKYDNVVSLSNRINRSFTAINKLGKSKQVEISQEFLSLKLEELHLVHEHREKVYEEREEQKRIKEEMREEEKARKEVEKATKDAERDAETRQNALEKARQEVAAATGEQHAKLEALVKKLEEELGEAIDRKAKAIARAQLTRSGHVYVISNIGSFGQGVFKIGMTRRLEPLDRVKELGDASVPFLFDVHAMIYSEDAPALERALHCEFDHRRVNRVNGRKEFFRVTLDEIRVAVEKHFGVITFVTVPQAEEYRKSTALEATEAEERLSVASA